MNGQACAEAELVAAEEQKSLMFCAIISAYNEAGGSASRKSDRIPLREVNRQIKGRQTKDLAAALALRDRLLEARNARAGQLASFRSYFRKAKAEGWPALSW